MWGTYLVEHYGPGSTTATLRRVARDVRRTTDEMTRRGQPVRYVRSTIVPGDQAFMATFEAASEALVREVRAVPASTWHGSLGRSSPRAGDETRPRHAFWTSSSAR